MFIRLIESLFNKPSALLGKAFLGLVTLIVLSNSVYIIEEGHVGVIKRFGEATKQVSPGLHFKVPFMDTVTEIEVRQRKNAEQMASSTSEQMPITVEVSVNWTVDKQAAFDLFRNYGGLAQFENRILDSRFRSVAKAVLPSYSAEQLIQDRASANNKIEAALIEEMAAYPISVENVQIENIVLPPKYIQSIETKQTEKNLADAEMHKLERQRLTSLQNVNLADAKAQSIEKVAKAEANAIKIKGLAEAKAIEAKAKALRNNPLIVELTKAQTWDGKLPQTVMGEGGMPIMDMRTK